VLQRYDGLRATSSHRCCVLQCALQYLLQCVVQYVLQCVSHCELLCVAALGWRSGNSFALVLCVGVRVLMCV